MIAKTPRLKMLATAAVVTAAMLAPSAAHAGLLVADAPNCSAQSLSQPFLQWADVAQYTLDPGGSFESGNSWSGGTVVSGNEPWNVTSADDSNSLSLTSGTSTTSNEICVGLEHPDLRFFAKASNPLAILRVDVLFEDAFGHTLSAPVGAVTGSTGWAPTAPMPVVANLLPLLPGGYTPVEFRFSATGGTWQIDDVYVDPMCRR